MWLISCFIFLHWTDSLVGCSFETHHFWLRILFFNVWPNFLIYEYCVWILLSIRKFYWHVCAQIKGTNQKVCENKVIYQVRIFYTRKKWHSHLLILICLAHARSPSRVLRPGENNHHFQIKSINSKIRKMLWMLPVWNTTKRTAI